MISETVSIDSAIRLLNELNQLDPVFIGKLINSRIPCNDELADHPTVQAGVHEGVSICGPLGVLNGLFGAKKDNPFKGWGAITAVMKPDDSVECFERTFTEMIG